MDSLIEDLARAKNLSDDLERLINEAESLENRLASRADTGFEYLHNFEDAVWPLIWAWAGAKRESDTQQAYNAVNTLLRTVGRAAGLKGLLD